MCDHFACVCMPVIGSIDRKGLGLFGANTLHMQPDLAGDID